MTRPCQVCGIPAQWLSVPRVWIHAEPRTLENNLHNGTRDHNAVVSLIPEHYSERSKAWPCRRVGFCANHPT